METWDQMFDEAHSSTMPELDDEDAAAMLLRDLDSAIDGLRNLPTEIVAYHAKDLTDLRWRLNNLEFTVTKIAELIKEKENATS